MMALSVRVLHKLLVVFALAMIVGCGIDGSQGGSTGIVIAELAWNPSGQSAAKTVTAAPPGVKMLRIFVSGAGMTTIQKDFTEVSGGTISGVSSGVGRNLTAQGLDGTGAVVYQGTAANLTVKADQVTNVGTIYMASAKRKGGATVVEITKKLPPPSTEQPGPAGMVRSGILNLFQGPSGGTANISACLSSYTGTDTDVHLDSFCKVAAFDACLHRATGQSTYDAEGRASCKTLTDLLSSRAATNTYSCEYCPYPY